MTVPLFTSALVDELYERAMAEERKAKAFDTRLRYSDAGACARKLAFEAAGFEPSDPMDLPGVYLTQKGTEDHELLQAAMARRFPGAEFETKSQVILCDSSGHADGIIPAEDVQRYAETIVVRNADLGDVLFELKNVGGYAFDKAIGLQRRGRKLDNPEGPRFTAILQAGMNAFANDCETVVIGYMSREAVSRQLADDAGLSEHDRILAEWHIPKDVWLPLVLTEIERQKRVLETVDAGYLPEGSVWNDDGSDLIAIHPSDKRPHWLCGYCPFRRTCELRYPGEVAL